MFFSHFLLWRKELRNLLCLFFWISDPIHLESKISPIIFSYSCFSSLLNHNLVKLMKLIWLWNHTIIWFRIFFLFNFRMKSFSSNFESRSLNSNLWRFFLWSICFLFSFNFLLVVIIFIILEEDIQFHFFIFFNHFSVYQIF